MGARVTATASPSHHDVVTDLGADAVFNYAREDLADAIVDAGRRDVVLDHRLDDYLGLDCQVAAFRSDIAAIGNEHVEATFPDVPAARSKALTVHHVSMFNTLDMGGVLERLATLMADGELTAVVERVYDLPEPRAHRRTSGRATSGSSSSSSDRLHLYAPGGRCRGHVRRVRLLGPGGAGHGCGWRARERRRGRLRRRGRDGLCGRRPRARRR
jgi:hypothetical protein